ncbi:hypothetical protein TNIN_218851, partial [Trichonephila inaurata madagascariensis]
NGTRRQTENETGIREARHKEDMEADSRLRRKPKSGGKGEKIEQKNSFGKRNEIEEGKMACGRADAMFKRNTK